MTKPKEINVREKLTEYPKLTDVLEVADRLGLQPEQVRLSIDTDWEYGCEVHKIEVSGRRPQTPEERKKELAEKRAYKKTLAERELQAKEEERKLLLDLMAKHPDVRPKHPDVRPT